jgi:hypothetical protein
MKTLREHLGKYSKPIEKTQGGITSQRADIVAKLIFFMGEDQTLKEEKELEGRKPGAGKEAKRKRISMRMKYWLGRTRNLFPGDIYKLMRQAKEGKNPPALFNYLLKRHNEKK